MFLFSACLLPQKGTSGVVSLWSFISPVQSSCQFTAQTQRATPAFSLSNLLAAWVAHASGTAKSSPRACRRPSAWKSALRCSRGVGGGMKCGWENIYDLVRSKQWIVTAAAANDEIHRFKFQLSLKLGLVYFYNDALSCGKPFEGGRLAISLITGPCL